MLSASEVPYFLGLTADKPEGDAKNGKEQGFIGMIPKVLEVLGVNEN